MSNDVQVKAHGTIIEIFTRRFDGIGGWANVVGRFDLDAARALHSDLSVAITQAEASARNSKENQKNELRKQIQELQGRLEYLDAQPD